MSTQAEISIRDKCLALTDHYTVAADLLYSVLNVARSTSGMRFQDEGWIERPVEYWLGAAAIAAPELKTIIEFLHGRSLLDVGAYEGRLLLRPSMLAIKYIAVSGGPWRHVISWRPNDEPFPVLLGSASRK